MAAGQPSVRPKDPRGALLVAVAAAMAVFHVLYVGGAFKFLIDPQKVHAVHAAFVLGLAFLVQRRRAVWQAVVYDAPWVALSAAVVVYVFVDFDGWLQRGGVVPTRADVVVGGGLVLLTLEAARRVTGPIIPILCLVAIGYGLAGPWLPAAVAHGGVPFATLVSFLFGDNGIYGVPVGISARYVYLFVLFGALLETSGVAKFIVDLAVGLVGGFRGGPAKVSIVTSTLFGTVSGSSVANVMVDGTINIPLMKAAGFSPAFAGGVEAMTSTGGQLVPPILGAAAFLMAEILGYSYDVIAVAALGPAFLYYVAAYWMIDLHARAHGLAGVPAHQRPNPKQVVLRSGYLILPVVVLLVLIMGLAMAPFRAVLYAMALALALSFLRPATRPGVRRSLDAIVDGAKRTIEVGVTCAAAGIVFGVMALTGLGGTLSNLVVGAAGGNLLLALLAIMTVAIVLGMGMPTVAAYALGASTLSPALIQLGVPPLAAHMFLFYFCVLASITPPVALASFAAAGLAGAPVWPTAIAATRLSLAGFVIPFMFVYGEGLLVGRAPWHVTALALGSGTVGTLCLAAAVTGHLVLPVAAAERAALALAAVLLIKPGIATDAAGLALLAVVFFRQHRRARAGARPAVPNRR